MQISNKGLQIIKNHEQLRLKAYDDKQPNVNITSASQVKGKLTIGYGHTGSDVYVGQVINEAKADALLKADLKTAETTVNKRVKANLTQNMYDALVSICFNIGITNFSGSTLLNLLNQNDYVGASNQFDVWRKSGGVVMQGLVIRRQEEKELFLEGYGVNTYYAMNQNNSNDGLILGGLGALILFG